MILTLMDQHGLLGALTQRSIGALRYRLDSSRWIACEDVCALERESLTSINVAVE